MLGIQLKDMYMLNISLQPLSHILNLCNVVNVPSAHSTPTPVLEVKKWATKVGVVAHYFNSNSRRQRQGNLWSHPGLESQFLVFED